MRALGDLWFRVRALFGASAMERELAEELRFHLDSETERLIANGLSADEARREALRRFGAPGRQRDRAREAWGLTAVRELQSDMRLAGRQLRRNPGFALAAVATLALGIGANTAIFSIVDEALLRSPPVTRPDELVAVYTTCRRGFPKCSSSYPDYVDYRDRSVTLAGLEASSSVPLSLGSDDAAPRGVTGLLVTGGYFSLLGTGTELGRPILPSDNSRGAPARVAVLSHRVWTEAFGRDTAIVGREIRLNAVPYTVIGVMPETFEGLDFTTRPDVWLPLFTGSALGPAAGAASDEGVLEERGSRWIGTLIGRRSPGVSLAQVRADMEALSTGLGEQYPDERAAMDGPRRITVDPVGRYILPLGNEAALRRFVWMLFGVVGLTLLLGAANLANLLLARATARRREMGIRLAVGAGRGRLIRQLMTESVTLSLLGGAIGLAVALAFVRVLSAFELPGGVAIGSLDVGLDGRVLLFAFGLSLVTALTFGLVPALRGTRLDLVSSLKDGTRRRGGGHSRLRKSLVAVQVALCLVLLAGAGLFLRSMWNSLDSDLGFRPGDLVAGRFNLALLRYSEAEATTFVNEILPRVGGIPGVEAATVTTLTPFQDGGFRGTFAEIAGYVPAPDEEIRFDYVLTGPSFFETLSTAVIEGRDFTAADVEGSRAVAIVNRHAADRYWGGTSPLGRTIRMGEQELEIVGVAEDVVWQQVGEDPTPFVFLPLAQHPRFATGFLTVVARAGGDPAGLIPLVRAAFRETEPDLSPTWLRTMDQQVGRALMPARMGSSLLTLFAALALALATVGIYGVVSYGVRERAHDIGVRIAVGATSARILREVVSDMVTPVALGLVLGAAAALGLTRLIEGFMFEVGARDPITFGVISLLLVAVALAATLVGARWATALDPRRLLIRE